jgi:hypothetical protein
MIEGLDKSGCRRYYYVNKLMFFDIHNQNESPIILDNNINSIIYYEYGHIIHSARFLNNYIADYIGQSIIKTSRKYILDSHNNLYILIRVDKKFVTKKSQKELLMFVAAYSVYL